MSAIEEKLRTVPERTLLLIGLFLGAVCYLALGSGRAEYQPQLISLKSESEKLSKKLEETIELTKNKARFQEELEKLTQTFRLAIEYIPKDSEVPELLKKIYAEARTAGVLMAKFTPAAPVPKDFYEEIPFEIRVRGRYVQVVGFLASISRLPRIVNIRNTDLNKPEMVDGYPQLELTGTLVAYKSKEAAQK